MSYIYAGTSYRNAHEAQIDQVHEWITGMGKTPTAKALAKYWYDADEFVDELVRDHRKGDWTIPDLPKGCERSDIVDLLEKWEEWARGQAICEIRDDLGLDQREMSDLLFLSGQQRISEYERGERTPSKRVVILAHYIQQDA